MLAGCVVGTIGNILAIICASKLFRSSADTMHGFVVMMAIGDLLLTGQRLSGGSREGNPYDGGAQGSTARGREGLFPPPKCVCPSSRIPNIATPMEDPVGFEVILKLTFVCVCGGGEANFGNPSCALCSPPRPLGLRLDSPMKRASSYR